MGKIRPKFPLPFLLLLAFFGGNAICFSQTTISGYVKDSIGRPIGASIVLKDSLLQSIIVYSNSDSNGFYKIKATKSGNFNLVFTAMGYASKIVALYVNNSQTELMVNALMENQTMDLEEVIIEAERPITIKNDTINFKAKYYTDGTEQTVEEMLKKIPGLQVDNDGKIRVGNQEIEKLMIDGDDLYEKGYKTLSKNMPAYAISEVEVLQNYSNNTLLKGVEDSNKVALNLKLDDKLKRIWFGNIEAGAGNNSFYEYKANLMNFGNKNKYYFLSNLNSIGYDATGDIDNLIHPAGNDEQQSIGDDERVQNFLSLLPESLNFKKSRANFNNSKLVSLNAIFNPAPKLKLKTLAFFNWDENSFYRNSTNTVNVNSANFTNTENYKLYNKKRVSFVKQDIKYSISATKIIEASTKYNNGNFNDDSNLVFNGSAANEKLAYKNSLFDQKISYTNKLSSGTVLLLQGRYINEKAPQNYKIDRLFYDELFPEVLSPTNVNQTVNSQMQYAGINAHLLSRKENGNLLEIQSGNEFKEDKLFSAFSLLDNQTVLAQPDDYQNQVVYQVNDLYLKGKYRYKLNNIAFTGRLELHQLLNHVTTYSNEHQQTPFFINPILGFDWKINTKNKILTSYSHNTANAGISEFYDNYILTGYRTFIKGMGRFSQVEASKLIVNYQLGNMSDRFFVNSYVIYNKNHDFYSTKTIVEQNYTQAEKILIHGQTFFNANSELNYYLKSLKSNLKLTVAYSQNEFKNIVNDSDFRHIKTQTVDYGLEFRSGFKSIFNFHAGTKWTNNAVTTAVSNSFTDNISFLDVALIFSEKFDFKVQSERYYFGNLKSANTYYFLDFDIRYKLIKNKLTLSVAAKNLTNTKEFKMYSLSDIGSSVIQYRLLPGFMLLKMEYRF